jgi:hypothetical protein
MDPGSLIGLTRPQMTTTFVLSHDLPSTYRTAIGQLLYLTTKTRPDIAAAVGDLARQVARPTKIHLTAVKRVIRCLKWTSEYGIRICPTTDKLIGHAQTGLASPTEIGLRIYRNTGRCAGTLVEQETSSSGIILN